MPAIDYNADLKKPRSNFTASEVAEIRKSQDQSAFCRCCTCGYTWQRGLSGSHSCTTHLLKKLQSIYNVAAEKNQSLQTSDEKLLWISEYISQTSG